MIIPSSVSSNLNSTRRLFWPYRTLCIYLRILKKICLLGSVERFTKAGGEISYIFCVDIHLEQLHTAQPGQQTPPSGFRWLIQHPFSLTIALPGSPKPCAFLGTSWGSTAQTLFFLSCFIVEVLLWTSLCYSTLVDGPYVVNTSSSYFYSVLKGLLSS